MTVTVLTGRRADCGGILAVARCFDGRGSSLSCFPMVDTFEGVVTDPQSLHKYLYGHADPVNNIDPTGLYALPGVGALYQMVVSALIGAPQDDIHKLADGQRVETNGGSYRELTVKERKLLDYFYKAAMPGLFEGEHGEDNSIRVSRVLSKVRIWDNKSISGWHLASPHYFSIVNPALNIFDNAAITLGNDQYYNDYPLPNGTNSLALIAHETFHSLHADATGSTTGFLAAYFADSLYAGYAFGSPYKMNQSEIYGHSIQDALEDMLLVPTFVAAFRNETEAVLPESMKSTIRDRFQHYLELHSQPAINQFGDYGPGWPAF